MSRTVVEVWVADLTFPQYMDRLWKLAEEFDARHPDYHVNIQGRDFRTLPLQIAEAAAEGTAPAIAEYYFSVTQAALDTLNRDGGKQFTSLEQAIGGRTEILGEPVVIDDIIPAIRDYYTYHGELASMPTVGTTSLLYANKGLLRAVGVDELPQTWAETEQVLGALAELPGLDHTVTWANHGTFFQQAVCSQGGLLSDKLNGRAGRATTLNLHSAEMLDWVLWWKKLHDQGHYLYTGKIPDWEGTLKAFAEQRVGLRITSSNDVNYMAAAARQAGFEIEVGGFPYNQDRPYIANAVAGTSLFLSGGLDEATQEGALAFLQFMHNPRNNADRHKNNSFVPITNASVALLEEEGWFDEHPYHRAATDHLAAYPPRVLETRPDLAGSAPESTGALFGDFAGVQDVMCQAMGDVLARGADPEERFRQATGQAQKLLDDYRADAAVAGPRNPQSVRVEYFTDAEAYSGADLENVARLAS
jgi:sn-glycerol 3-phosphate transport system substrate-binding protein